FLFAWTLPVVKGGVTLPNGIPGWQAFRVAASPVWPYEGTRVDSWYAAILSAASAATNLIMVELAYAALRGRTNWLRFGAVAAVVSFLINAQWILPSDRNDLRVGYYLWWASFLILSIASLQRRFIRAEASNSTA